MDLKTAVIIATKGRPQEVSNLLRTLALQTVPPNMIVVSACDRTDIEQDIVDAKAVHVLFGSPGLAAQRNRALSLVHGNCDIVIFFDDDFIPSRFWIERIQMLIAAHPDVGGVTGRILRDGAMTGGISWPDGQSIVDKADSSMKMVTIGNHSTKDESPYGCNMAFRSKLIEHLRFDERLVLYGWLEDRDFGFRAATGGRTISTDLIWGVHLGTTRGRISGLRFGYSQMVNPWYLMQKGSMKPFDAYRCIVRWLSSNALGVIFQNSTIDRWGRLKGNIIGIKDIVLGHWAPEKVTEL